MKTPTIFWLKNKRKRKPESRCLDLGLVNLLLVEDLGLHRETAGLLGSDLGDVGGGDAASLDSRVLKKKKARQ